MGLGRLLEACQVHEKVALEHSSKSTKYELKSSYNNPIHEHFSFLKTAQLRESAMKVQLVIRDICCSKQAAWNGSVGGYT